MALPTNPKVFLETLLLALPEDCDKDDILDVVSIKTTPAEPWKKIVQRILKKVNKNNELGFEIEKEISYLFEKEGDIISHLSPGMNIEKYIAVLELQSNPIIVEWLANIRDNQYVVNFIEDREKKRNETEKKVKEYDQLIFKTTKLEQQQDNFKAKMKALQEGNQVLKRENEELKKLTQQGENSALIYKQQTQTISNQLKETKRILNIKEDELNNIINNQNTILEQKINEKELILNKQLKDKDDTINDLQDTIKNLSEAINILESERDTLRVDIEYWQKEAIKEKAERHFEESFAEWKYFYIFKGYLEEKINEMQTSLVSIEDIDEKLQAINELSKLVETQKNFKWLEETIEAKEETIRRVAAEKIREKELAELQAKSQEKEEQKQQLPEDVLWKGVYVEDGRNGYVDIGSAKLEISPQVVNRMCLKENDEIYVFLEVYSRENSTQIRYGFKPIEENIEKQFQQNVTIGFFDISTNKVRAANKDFVIRAVDLNRYSLVDGQPVEIRYFSKEDETLDYAIISKVYEMYSDEEFIRKSSSKIKKIRSTKAERKYEEKNGATVGIVGGDGFQNYYIAELQRGGYDVYWNSGFGDLNTLEGNITNSDYVIIMTQFMNHVVFGLVINYCEKHDIPFFYCNTTGKESVRKLVDEKYQELMKEIID